MIEYAWEKIASAVSKCKLWGGNPKKCGVSTPGTPTSRMCVLATLLQYGLPDKCDVISSVNGGWLAQYSDIQFKLWRHAITTPSNHIYVQETYCGQWSVTMFSYASYMFGQ